MAKKGKSVTYFGSLSFLFGVAIAIIIGIINPAIASTTLTSLLILLGLIVGFLNVTTKERNSFLLATVSLVLVSFFGGAVLGEVAVIGIYLEAVLRSMLTFVIPATIIVALKAVYSLEENR